MADAAQAALARVSAAESASSSGGGSVRASSAEERKRLAAVIAATEAAEAAALAAEAQREAALRAVKVAKEDIAYIATAWDLPPPLAERALREAGGDADAASARLLGAAPAPA